jgi:hypothetical protein
METTMTRPTNKWSTMISALCERMAVVAKDAITGLGLHYVDWLVSLEAQEHVSQSK